MNQTIAIIGIGEMGAVFARGFLRCAYPVYPVTRQMQLSDAIAQIPDPVLVLVAVAEKDLSAVLAGMPECWHDRLGLLQLILKNLFILTLNIAGLKTGGTVADLWLKNNALARSVAHEIIELQEWKVQSQLPRERLLADLEKAIHADLNHRCIGRAAGERFERAVKLADKAGLAAPTIRKIHARLRT